VRGRLNSGRASLKLEEFVTIQQRAIALLGTAFESHQKIFEAEARENVQPCATRPKILN
jgi:hypothetical protein